MLDDPRLVEDDVLLGVDAGGEERRGDRTGLVAEILIDELRRQRMHVDDAIDAIGLLLEGDEFLDGAEVVAEMQVASRLDAGKDEWLEGGHEFLMACGGPFRARRKSCDGALMDEGECGIKRRGSSCQSAC